MKKEWLKTTLGDVAAVQSGTGFPVRYQGQADGHIPFYKVSDMNIAGNEREMMRENNSITEGVRRELGAFLFPKGSILFPKIGGAIATNKKRLSTCDCCVDNNVMGVIPKRGRIDSEFLFYFFLSHDLSEFANKAHLPSIRKTVVEAWPIAVPPLAEQQRIVRILDEAFEGIATATANAERNAQNARALFESCLHSVFSGRGAGWVDRPLGDVCDILDSQRRPVTKRYRKNGEYPYYGATGVLDFVDGYLFDEPLVLVGEDGAKWGAGERTAYAIQGKCWVNNHAHVLRPHRSELLDKWLIYYLNVSDLSRFISGLTVPKLNQARLREIEIAMPPIAEQRHLLATANAVGDETQRFRSVCERKLVALDALKASLLQQAFAGEL